MIRLVREILYITNVCEMFYDPSKSVLQMLANAFANLMNVLQMKCECKTWVSNLHNTHCTVFLFVLCASARSCPISLFSFKFGLIFHICPAFCGNVNTNAGQSLQTSYHHFCLAINKNGLRLLTNMLWMSQCQNSSKFLSVSYLMKTADVIMIFFPSHNTTYHT